MSARRARGIRVIAGSARGRKLVVPAGAHVRPTKDIVREAMFSALDARGALVDAHVLDLYGGSGALAIEALSRGAADAVIVERDRHALEAIAENLSTIGLDDRVRVVRVDAEQFVRRGAPAGSPFDLVFVDPPYDTADDVITSLLSALGGPGWVADDGIVTVERPPRHPVGVSPGWRTGWERAFGDTLLTFCWR